MSELLTINTLSYFCVTLFIALAGLFLYARNINKRLKQSIKLINDLYRLSQEQTNTVASLVSEIKGLDEQEAPGSSTAPGNMPMGNHLVSKVMTELEPLISDNMKNIESHVIELNTESKIQLEKRILKLENETQQLQQENPELKMYNRANKLVKEGASVEDVMEASQLPRAEVEVLVGMHSRNKDK